MRQEINFYRGGTRAPVPVLGADWMLKATLAMLALLGLISAVQFMVNRNLSARLFAASQQAENLERQVKALQLRYPEPKADAVLVAEADRLQRRRDGLERLLNTVEDGDEMRRGGFSEYFQALARQAVPEVWLTGIHVTAGGSELALQGRALDAANIPRMVQALGKERSFKARTFSALTITRPEQQPGQVDFVLRTHVPKNDKSG